MENFPTKKTFMLAMAGVAALFVVAMIAFYLNSRSKGGVFPNGVFAPGEESAGAAVTLQGKQTALRNQCIELFNYSDFSDPGKMFLGRMNEDIQNISAYFGYIVASSIDKKDNSMCGVVDKLELDNNSDDCNFWYSMGRLAAENCSDSAKQDLLAKWSDSEKSAEVGNVINGFCDGVVKKDINACEGLKNEDMPYAICRAVASDDPEKCENIASGKNKQQKGGSECRSFYYVAKMLLSDYKKDLTDQITEVSNQYFFRMMARFLSGRDNISAEKRAETAWNGFCQDKADAFIGGNSGN